MVAGRLVLLRRHVGSRGRRPRRPGVLADRRPVQRRGQADPLDVPRRRPPRGRRPAWLPAGVTLDAVIQVDDPQRPANSGPWHLSVAGGSGTAEPAGTLPGTFPVFTVGAFSALFAGVPTATLRRSGTLTGPADAHEVFDAAFHARPHMLDHY
ncbi:sterol carrier protein domain-containing protein [Streptosporangium lutulentum]